MSWSFSVFLILLLIVIGLFTYITLAVNEFEKKVDSFIVNLRKRYDLSQLSNLYAEKQKGDTEEELVMKPKERF